jgi:F-type H+-transporting ATPase subunit b
MKKPGFCGVYRMIKRKGAIALVLAVLLSFCVCGIATASGGGGEHGAEAKGWAATDTYRVMNFAVLAVALFFILRKPVAQALNSRIEGIKEQLSELESKKEEAEKELAEYNKKLSLLEQEAERIVEEYVKQGNEAKARILKEAESAAEKLEEHARRNIEHEFEQAKLKLQEEILEKALVKAENILKAKITSNDQDRLVDEYLEKVVA